MPLYLKDKLVSGTGAPGKSAYEAAKAGGYTGTEASFNQALKEVPGHIADTENPHGVTAAQVGTYTKDEANALLANKAPAGYGLGDVARWLEPTDDLNNIKTTGWYRWFNSPINAPGDFGAMTVVVTAEDGGLFQEVVFVLPKFNGNYNYEVNCKVRRVCYQNTWQPWEWVNPPMKLNNEYRTTERFYGYPVYKKLVTLGKVPAAGSTATIDGGHKISGIKFAISAVPLLYQSNWTTALQGNKRIDDIDFSTTSLSVKISSAAGDLTSYDLLVLLTYAKAN